MVILIGKMLRGERARQRACPACRQTVKTGLYTDATGVRARIVAPHGALCPGSFRAIQYAPGDLPDDDDEETGET